MEEVSLNDYVEEFYIVKGEADKYKKLADEDNKKIKELMQKDNLTEFETDNGLIAKMNTQQRESFNETALIEKLKEIDKSDVLDLVEIINWDKVEDMIYNGKLDPSILAPYKETKEVITLKVSKKKGE